MSIDISKTYRLYVESSYKQKDKLKQLGAKWDPKRGKGYWYFTRTEADIADHTFGFNVINTHPMFKYDPDEFDKLMDYKVPIQMEANCRYRIENRTMVTIADLPFGDLPPQSKQKPVQRKTQAIIDPFDD